jgi:hypothetical protein
MGVLTIYLDKCTDIADTDVVGEGDPYITFSLEQDNIVREVFCTTLLFVRHVHFVRRLLCIHGSTLDSTLFVKSSHVVHIALYRLVMSIMDRRDRRPSMVTILRMVNRLPLTSQLLITWS